MRAFGASRCIAAVTVRMYLDVAMSVSYWCGGFCWSSHLLVITSAPASACTLTYTISGTVEPSAAHLQVLALCHMHNCARSPTLTRPTIAYCATAPRTGGADNHTSNC